jgi:hypothetical protein
MAFKMKGSPMQRNFGIGSPMQQKKEKTYMLPEVKVVDKKLTIPEHIKSIPKKLARGAKQGWEGLKKDFKKMVNKKKSYPGGSERHKLSHPGDKGYSNK